MIDAFHMSPTLNDLKTGYMDTTVAYVHHSVLKELRDQGVEFPLLADEKLVSVKIEYCNIHSQFTGMFRFITPVNFEQTHHYQELKRYMELVKSVYGPSPCWGFMRIEGSAPLAA